MKKIIILSFLLLSVLFGLKAQNNIDPQVLSGTYVDTLLNRSIVTATVNLYDTTVYQRKMTDFVRGWNYGFFGRQLDELMSINADLHHWESTNDSFGWDYYGDSINWYIRIKPFGSSSDVNVCSVHALYYEPAITVDQTEGFTPGPENKNGAIFGFMTKDIKLGSPINNRVVTNNTLDTIIPFLSNVWPKDELRFWNDIEDETHDTIRVVGQDTIYDNTGYEEGNYGQYDQRSKFNCKEMLLSVNVKSHSPTILINLDVPLIKLKLKIFARNDTLKTSTTNYIKFDTLPGTILQDIYSSMGQNRGKTRNMIPSDYHTREFIITPRMLITSTTSTSSAELPITLSAGFHCWYPPNSNPFDTNNYFNPYFKPKDNIYHDSAFFYEWYIDSMDVEVWYSKASGYDAEIDWIRLESPGAMEMFRGKHDKYIHKKVWQVQEMFRDQAATHHNKIAGFYSFCEMTKNQWAPARYFTMLMDTLSNSECNKLNYPSQIDFATGYKSFFNGNNLDYVSSSAVPFIYRGNCYSPKDSTFGWIIGYGGYYSEYRDPQNNLTVYDSIFSTEAIKNSRYETILHSNPERNVFEINDYSIYDKNSNDPGFLYPYGKLYANECIIHNSYYNRRSVLFGNKPWIAWQWIHSVWAKTTDFNGVYNDGNTPLTGEELSLLAFQPIAFGAKGQYFWGKTKEGSLKFSDTTNLAMHIDLQPSESEGFQKKLDTIEHSCSTCLDSILTHKQMYGDFIDFTRNLPYDTLYQFANVTDTNSYNWNLMNIPKNRVYIGLNSIRTGLARHNQWVKKNSAYLMNLKLICWQGKGFSKFYQQDTSYYDDIIWRFIDKDFITTRPLNRMQNGYPLYEQGAIDSGFYDIMIHKNGTASLDDEFTLAVVNRRCDPLIFDSVDNKFYFISTNEFENLTTDTLGGQKANPITGEMKDTSYWREMYWKKQGSREIRIKMNYFKANIDYGTTLLRVKEILADDSLNNSWAWWQKDRWNNAIHDTIIKLDQDLVLKMAPGSGRMFKFEVLHTAPFTGALANSNQTKIIAYPAHQTSNLDYTGHDTALYYHVVYHKINPISGHYDTYYRRSIVPYNHTVNTKIIQWGPEIKLINNFKVTNQSVPNLRQPMIRNLDVGNCDCKYPTLTARWDSVHQTAKIYILSSCTETTLIDTPRVYIVERSFPTDMNLIQFPTGDTSLAIGFAYAASLMNGLYSDRWGLSTINSSKDGNYMAWNDSIYGIKAAFKLPHDSGYATNMIKFKFNDSMNYNALFPSLNTFSMIPYWDDNAGLAWQETQLGNSDTVISKIYYTILRRNIYGNIYKYIPGSRCDSPMVFQNFTYKNNNSISGLACISPTPAVTYYTYPIVYRNVEDVLDQNGNIAALGAGDRVYWQGGLNRNSTSAFYIKMIDLNIGLNCFNCMFPKKVYSSNSQLAQPNASQGEMRLDSVRGPFNWSDSSYVVDFISYPIGTQPSYTNASIYQIDHNYWGIFQQIGQWNASDTLYWKVDYNAASLGTGLYPHLVRSAVLRKAGDWKLNNRIYESACQIIKTSETYFLKGEKEYKASYPMLKLVDMRTEESSSFSPFAISNDDNPQMNNFLKINAFEKKGFSYSALDTISTPWFKIGNIRDLSFFTNGNDLKGINITLERKKDKKKFTLPVKNSKQNIMAMNKLHFINGKDDLYRIIWTKSNDSIIVTSDLLFSDKIDFEGRIDTVSSHALGKSITLDENIIDLNWDNTVENNANLNVFVCPNPANDLIYASTNLPLDLYNDRNIKSVKIKYILINTLGTVITEKEGYPGDVIQFNTSELPNGMYIIQALTDIYNSNHYKNLNGYKSIIIRH